MGEQTTMVLVLVLLFGGLMAGLFYIPRFFVRRAMRDLVSLLREREATTPAKAVTPEELGLVRGGPMERMFKLRDYRPQALRLLVQTNIIRATEVGTLYLSEEELERSPVKKFAGIE